MKNVTFAATEEDIWNWKAAAVRERKRLGEWITWRLNARVGASKPAEPKIPETKKGLEEAGKKFKEHYQ